MTLEQVVARALQHSPQVAQAAGAVQTATTAERTALGAFLPNLNLSSNATLASTNRFDPTLGTTISGSSDSYSAGMSTAWTCSRAAGAVPTWRARAPRRTRSRPRSSSSATPSRATRRPRISTCCAAAT
jgi:hypothetical protein